jgi:hypothetical protein
MLRVALLVMCFPILIAGCGKPVEEKMGAICIDVAKTSASDPSALIVNSVSAKPVQATKESLMRFSGLWSEGKLNYDQQRGLEIQMEDMTKIKEAYAEVDFTDRSGSARRGKAVCWFMDQGEGFKLGSVSVAGQRYTGIDLVALFVNYKRPEYLDSSNRVQ